MNCENIIFFNFNFGKLKYLELKIDYKDKDKVLTSNKKMIKFPELNTLILSYLNSFDPNTLIDFKSLENLKYSKGFSKNFMFVDEISPLEKIIIDFYTFEENIMEKLISMNTIKEMDLNFHNIDNSFDKLKKPISKNCSLSKINLFFNGLFPEDLNYFLDLFPNLTDLTFKSIYHKKKVRCFHPFREGPYKKKENEIQIIENPLSKISNIKIALITEGVNKDILKFDCQPYDKIKSFDLYIESINIDNIPFFKNCCDIIFDSLRTFKFVLHFDSEKIFKRVYELIKNLYNNIDKIPNLKDFDFSYFCKDITNDFFIMFVEKILTLKSIRNVNIKINTDNFFYSKDDLQKLFPKINFNKFHNIKVFTFIPNKIYYESESEDSEE